MPKRTSHAGADAHTLVAHPDRQTSATTAHLSTRSPQVPEADTLSTYLTSCVKRISSSTRAARAYARALGQIAQTRDSGVVRRVRSGGSDEDRRSECVGGR